MTKVMTILGTRPELIKMSRVIPLFDKFTNHILVHTGQNYDDALNEIFFRELKIRRPNYYLNINKESPANAIADVIVKVDKLLSEIMPDAILIYGDTNSGLACIPAKKRKIPIFHMEAGNRCFDLNVPEESNRKIIDHLSDVNLTLTTQAKEYLISEGVDQALVFKVGSHMPEVLQFYSKDIDASNIQNKLNLQKNKYIVVSVHREENVDSQFNLHLIISALNAIANKFDFPIIVSTHPRTKARLKNLEDVDLHSSISFMEPFGFFDYISLQKNSYCVLSDSGTLTEEASFFKFPCVMLRSSHERPEGMDAGVSIMSGLASIDILQAIDISVGTNSNYQGSVADYHQGPVSYKILKIVISYIDYVNKRKWMKFSPTISS